MFIIMIDFVNIEQKLKRLKIAQGIIIALATILFAAVGFIYWLLQDIEHLEKDIIDLQNDKNYYEANYIRHRGKIRDLEDSVHVLNYRISDLNKIINN